MKKLDLKQKIIVGGLSVVLLFSSGCAYMAAAPLTYALVKAVEQRVEVEEAKSRARRAREDYNSYPTEKRLVSTVYPADNDRIISTKTDCMAKEKDEALAKLEAQLNYLENRVISLDNERSKKLQKYEGAKHSLSELEASLDNLKKEIIQPDLEIKARYESMKRNYQNQQR